MVEKFSTGVVHQPVAKKECKKCHQPHGVVGSVYLRQPVPEQCFGCHEAEWQQVALKYRHSPFAKGECGSCHEVHNSPN
ncbi:MAG: hypothetical protein KAS94_05590, partial [Desulfobulbaceae bacterium]|nr:hypothetical protein [Desulfobulbaceae bacterium]